MNFNNFIEKKAIEHKHVVSSSISNFYSSSVKIFKILTTSIKKNKTIFTCGNGGSASDALHFSGEFVSKFKSINRKPINCICLNANISAITSIGNDFNYDLIFSRQLEAHALKGDTLFLFSTSGKSKNIFNAAKVAKKLKLNTILFTGLAKTNLHDYCDIVFQVNSKKTDLIQEAHIFFYHIICDFFESYK